MKRIVRHLPLLVLFVVLLSFAIAFSGCAVHQTPDALDIASGVLSTVIM